MFKFLTARVEGPMSLCVHRQAAAIGVFLRLFRFGGLAFEVPAITSKNAGSGNLVLLSLTDSGVIKNRESSWAAFR
jgi:hypothetical protein